MAMNFNSNWEQIQQGVSETERLIRQKDYNASMIKARLTLEFMVRILADRAGIQDDDLKSMIDQLYDSRRISKSACEHYHKIRIFGNKAVHEGDTNAYNANQAYHMLSQEVYTFATDNGLAKRSTGQAGSGRAAQTGSRAVQNQNAPTLRTSVDGPSTIPGSGRSSQPRGQASSRSRQGSSAARSSQGQSRTAQTGSRRRQPQRRQALTMYDLLKLLVPILCIVLLFFVVKLFKPDSKPEDITTTPATVETPAETAPPETLPEETDAPAVTYKTTTVLNVRPQPNTTDARIGQLDAGVTVEYIRAHDNDWAVILYNGQEAYVASQYLTAE